MSWMDTWSRPSKLQSTPAPFYLRPGGEDTPYCKSCGRIIGARKAVDTASSSTPAKYCSSRCRSQKPGPLDRQVEAAFVKFLNGDETIPGAETKHGRGEKKGRGKIKGDERVLVPCDVVEEFVFGQSSNATDTPSTSLENHVQEPEIGQQEHDDVGNHAPNVSGPNSMDRDITRLNAQLPVTESATTDGHRVAALSVRSGTRIRPAQDVSEVNGSVGGEKGRAERTGETADMLEKRIHGQKRAREKEMVRCAARRGVVFGFVLEGGGGPERRKCEAVMQGKVVEPSFAKGDWGIRWRE